MGGIVNIENRRTILCLPDDTMPIKHQRGHRPDRRRVIPPPRRRPRLQARLLHLQPHNPPNQLHHITSTTTPLEPPWRKGHKGRKRGRKTIPLPSFTFFALLASLRFSPISLPRHAAQIEDEAGEHLRRRDERVEI